MPYSPNGQRGGGVQRIESIYIIQELYIVYLARFRTYQIAKKNLLYHPKLKPRRGGRLRQINTCRHVPLQTIFKKSRHLGLESIRFLVHDCNNKTTRIGIGISISINLPSQDNSSQSGGLLKGTEIPYNTSVGNFLRKKTNVLDN